MMLLGELWGAGSKKRRRSGTEALEFILSMKIKTLLVTIPTFLQYSSAPQAGGVGGAGHQYPTWRSVESVSQPLGGSHKCVLINFREAG